jgi:pimeloyl-ACP methyl ester carboxylesterase
MSMVLQVQQSPVSRCRDLTVGGPKTVNSANQSVAPADGFVRSDTQPEVLPRSPVQVTEAAADPFQDLEDHQKLPGFDLVFGSLAVVVNHAIRLTGWLKQHLGHKPQATHGSHAKRTPSQSPLAALPSVKLDRPVIFVPGFNMKASQFDDMTNKLLEEKSNGSRTLYVRDGKFFEDMRCSKPAQASADSKVFVASFHQRNETPDQTAPQLDADLEAISKLTGQPKIDAVGYSMGGLSTRVYLDDGGDKVGRFAMVATPNQGSALAKLSSWLIELKQNGRSVDAILNLKHVQAKDHEALHWLRPTDGHRPNLHLQDINSRWPNQRARVEDAKVFGSVGKSKTYTTYIWPTKGDGTVTGKSLLLPGLPSKTWTTPQFASHSALTSSPELFTGLTEFLKWTSQSS